MAAVEGPGVDPVDMAHQRRKIALPGVQHEVVVVAHQAIRQQLRVEPRQPLGHHRQQPRSVCVVDKDVLAPVATRSDVIQRPREFDAQRA
jgi:hypothetical protein